MACDVGAALKVAELILCIVCLIYKRYSDNEALQTFLYLKKISREWPFLNNITWDENGALLADVTFGGYTIITLGLLVAQVTGELRRATKLNTFFMVVGALMFFIVGGLCLAALDQVPNQLVDNAIVLGILSIVTGLLFLVDLAVVGKKKNYLPSTTKPKQPATVISVPQPLEKIPEEKKDTSKEIVETKSKKNFGNGVIKELRSSLKKKKSLDIDGRGVFVDKPERSVEFENNDPPGETEKVQKSIDDNDNRQYGRRRMDNRGFSRAASDDSGRFSGDRFRDDFVDAERDRRFDRDYDRFDSRNVSVVEGPYEGRRSRAQSSMEVELDEHYLRPQDYFVEKRITREERRVQDQRVTSSRHDLSDDEEFQAQLPSVSYLLSERGRKVMPSLSASPLERLHDMTTPSANGKPRYYFNTSRDPASGSSAPPSPRTPGFVLSTATQWDKESSERTAPWYRNRLTSKAPP